MVATHFFAATAANAVNWVAVVNVASASIIYVIAAVDYVIAFAVASDPRNRYLSPSDSKNFKCFLFLC